MGLPDSDARVVKLTDEEYKALHDITTSSTACMRRYISTWKIKDNKLYLIAIKGRYKLSTEVPLLADWFTDILKIPAGKILHQDLITPLADIYENEICMSINKGAVISSKIIDRHKEYETIYGSVKNMTREVAIEKLRKFINLDND